MSVARQLLSLAEAEVRLVADTRYDELPALYEDRDRLIAQLPDRLPAAELQLLERAVTMQRLTADALRAARDGVAAELQHVEQGRATVRAYAPAGVRPVRTVDARG